MATYQSTTEAFAAKSLESQETQALLRGIINELRNINSSLARQEETIEALSRIKLGPHPSEKQFISQLELKTIISEPLVSPKSTTCLSVEMRIGYILQEALTRYNLNAVPSWSCLYGTHLMRGEGPETAEDSNRNIEWTSVVGDCWRIPHDNRLSLCFQAPISDIAAVVRVRNFVSSYHRPEHLSSPKYSPKGEYFNVWDWFDTGISAYWCPGKMRTSTPWEFPHSDSQYKNSYPLSTMIAPWRRMINMQGLTSLSTCDDSINLEDLTDKDLCPFLSETKNSVFQDPMDEVLWRAVKCHLRCLRVSETDHGAMETKGWVLFHVTFYEILSVVQRKKMTELWPSGELHSDCHQNRSRPRTIRESALTIIAIPSVELPGAKVRSIFWTMLCMRPQQFPHIYYSENRDDLSRGITHEMLDDMSDLVYGSLLAVIGRWEEIADYFDSLLVEKNGLLNPQYHDSLLTDDSAFTRSRKYFWAIEFLKEAESSVLGNIHQEERFVALLNANPPAESAQKVFTMRLKRHGIALQKLEALRNGFRSKQDEAKALRDGLFSASAVMESRAATQLGQNIKLLTYVSIFFLPISLCTSFWSISDSLFSLSSLATVMPIVAISTYIIVLNVDNIIQLLLPIYTATFVSPIRYFIDSQTRGMQSDPSSIWNERGSALEKFRYAAAGSSTGRPSQWRIIQFALLRVGRSVWPAFQGLKFLFPRALENWRSGHRAPAEGPYIPSSLAHLGDVHVQVQVEVDMGKADI